MTLISIEFREKDSLLQKHLQEQLQLEKSLKTEREALAKHGECEHANDTVNQSYKECHCVNIHSFLHPCLYNITDITSDTDGTMQRLNLMANLCMYVGDELHSDGP